MAFNYNGDIDALIQDLIDGYQGTDTQTPLSIKDFNGAILKGLEERHPDFWKALLEYMKNETDSDKLGHSPMLQSDFPQDFQSLFKYINAMADLDSADDEVKNQQFTLDALKQAMLQAGLDSDTATGVKDNKTFFWNESVSRAISQFLQHFDTSTRNGVEINKNPKVEISLADIKKADAGNSFNTTSTSTKPWVVPNINADGENYPTVRGTDKILSVLNNQDNLQFTHSQNSPWLRLIMPKYLRAVEVEDLNRNFWVIGQVLSAVCAYLFDDDAPFAEIFKNILSELVQLWENILYLWAAIALITEKKTITDIHVEIMPMNNSEWENYIKFDNFRNLCTNASDPFDTEYKYEASGNAEKQMSEVAQRMHYLIEQYTGSNLCIIPLIRSKNYKHNYYTKEIYPGIIFYNRNTSKESFFTFDPSPITIDAETGSVDEEKYALIAGAIKETELNYYYMFPVQSLDHGYSFEPYYLLLRTIPEIQVQYNTEKDSIDITKFTIKVYDVSRELSSKNEELTPIQMFYMPSDETEKALWSSSYTENTVHDKHIVKYYETILNADSVVDPPLSEPLVIPIEKGYYKGEFPSYCYAFSAPTYDIDLVGVELVPFASALDDIKAFLDNNTNMTSADTAITNLLQNAGKHIPQSEKKAFEDAERSSFISLSTTDLYPKSGESKYSKDFWILKKHGEEVGETNNDRSKKKFTLYLGNHITNMWGYHDKEYVDGIHVWKSREYRDFNNSTGKTEMVTDTSPRRYYEHHANNFNRGAVLYNPMTTANREIVTEYPDYYSDTYIPDAWLISFKADSQTDSTFTSTSSSYYTVYLDGSTVMRENNWYIKYVQVNFGVWVRDEISNKFISNYQYNTTIGGESKSLSTMVCQIYIHFFTHDGRYACKVIDRYRTIPKNHTDNIYESRLERWTVDYSGSPTTKAKAEELYKELNEAKDDWIILKESKPGVDYELYPNTGSADTEKYHSEFYKIGAPEVS